MSKETIDDMNSVREICKTHNKIMYWYGDWYCPECMKEYERECYNLESEWISQGKLCWKCFNFDGEGSCSKYPGMYYDMFCRKNKCKYFVEMEWRRNEFGEYVAHKKEVGK